MDNWSKSNSEQEINYTYYIPSEQSTDARLQAIDEAVSEGATTIICSGYLYAPALIEAQSKYPNVKFIGIDIALGDMTEDYVDYYEPTENTMLITYREEQAGFLAGYAAVKLGYRKLGFLGGMGIPTVLRYGYGYVQGANAAAEELGVADEVEIEYTYANCFNATHDLTALMQEWYSNGTEVVFACGGGIYMSVAEAAAMYGGKVIGVDADQAEIIDGFYGEGITLTTAVKGFAYSVEYALDAIYNRSAWNLYGGKCTNFGAQDGGDSGNGFVMLPESTQFDDSFTYEDYVALWNKLASGEIMVSDDFQVPPTVSVAVNYH